MAGAARARTRPGPVRSGVACSAPTGRGGRLNRGGSEVGGGSAGCVSEAVPGKAGGNPGPQRHPAAARGAPGH